MDFTLDTNIMSYLLKGDKSILKNVQNIITNGEKLIINPITFYEIYRGLLNKKAVKQLNKFEQYCNQFENCEFSRKTFIIAAEIYSDLKSNGKLIDDADIFIAALCIENGFVLITNNEKHFNRVKKLKFLNWVCEYH